MPHNLVPIARALISVSDKTGLEALAAVLKARGIEILSTGGTASALQKLGVEVLDVAEATGFPEMMDGRLKSLHPRIHGGLLAVRADPAHQAAMIAHGIRPIDLLIVNLYPFEATLNRDASFEERIENIDVGGPAMIRGAAKNHCDVAVIVEPEDYARLIGELEAHDGATSLGFRRAMAQKAYARTAAYDSAISNWLADDIGEPRPAWRAFGGRLANALRYGENPHQNAGFYVGPGSRPGVATARQVQGKELSYNNINDTDAAYELVAEFGAGAQAAVAIIKHANPCGVGLGDSLSEAYDKALACDPVSAFGGIVAMNHRLDAASARKIVEIFTEVIIAPEADEEALAIVASKKNLRLLLAGALPDPLARTLTARSVAGGMLVQERDAGALDEATMKVVTKRAPTAREMADLRFAWRVCKHVKSNAIVFARDGATVGIGAGQMSRVDSARIAVAKAHDVAKAHGDGVSPLIGSVLASDAFFPFADGVEAAAKAGATAIIQPGGAMRDSETIAAAEAAGIAMVFTGMRHFRH